MFANQGTCKGMALRVMVIATLSFAPSATLRAAGSGAWQASNQDKINTCNNLADKKGLTGNDRKSFMQDCLNKAANSQPPSEMSNKDKANSCKDLADKRGLTGSDRRSFLKDCMNKLNSK
jgi:post-segregation antitoxin (ccd killing protein)